MKLQKIIIIYLLIFNIKNHNINAFKYIQTITNEKNNKTKTTIFRYITNLESKNCNIDKLINLGRKRWKIENEGFYTQKHRTFNITHLNSRNDNTIKVHYFFIQFAHTIRQLLEQGNLLVKLLKIKIKEVSLFLIKALTSITTSLNEIDKSFQLRFDT